MALFRSRNEDTLEALAPKLDAARAALSAAEAELREQSVEAALADDPGAALRPCRDAITTARQTVEALELAEGELRRREAQRKAEARAAAEKSRVRAVQQHAASAAKAAAEVRKGLEQAVAGWIDLMRSGEKVERLLTPQENRAMFGHSPLADVLANLIHFQAARSNALASPALRFPLAPRPGSVNSFGGLVRHGQHVLQVEPIEEQVRRRLSFGPAVIAEAERVSYDTPSPLDAGQPTEEVEPQATGEPEEAEFQRQ